MPLNLTKVYNNVLDLEFMAEKDRTKSLMKIFDRDIANNDLFQFREKIIRPIKVDGKPALDILFNHLTCSSVLNRDNHGREFKSRSIFDIKRSQRLHWIWHHIQEKDEIRIFSVNERVNGKDVIRTYLWDVLQDYVIVLEPFRETKDYYLLTAYYLEKELGGINAMKKRYKRKLDDIY